MNFKLTLTTFLLVFILKLSAQNLYTSGQKQWNTTNSNWGTAQSGPYNSAWANMNNAYFQDSAGTTTLNGFDPRLAGIYALENFTLQSNASEKVYLSGTSSPYIDVSSGKTFTLSSPLCGGLGFTKRSEGILTLGNINNRFWGTVNLAQGQITFSDNSNKPARAALRCNPVAMGSGALLYYSGSNASNICMGSLSGSGDIDAGSNGLVSFMIFSDASSNVNIETGANGFTLYGYYGTYTQTLNGDLRSLAGTISVYGTRKSSSTSSANLRLWNNSSSNGAATDGNASAYLQGGRLFFDNSSSNAGSGSSTNRFYDAGSITLAGGLLEMKGNSGGSIESVGNILLNTGSSSIKVEHTGGSSGTELISSGTSLYAANSVINFISSGGTIGSSGANPRITFGGALPTNTTNGMLSQSSGANAASIGWAVVNGNKWAGQNGSNSIIELSETIRDTIDLASATQWEITNYTPTSHYTLTLPISPGALKITQNVNYTLNNHSDITTTAIMLEGSSTTIQGYGTLGNGTNPRYFWVNNASSTLTLNHDLDDYNADIIKAGQGTLALTFGTSLVSFTSLANVTVLEGTLRTSGAELNGASSSGGAYTNINLFGGILELNNVSTFSRAIGVTGTSSGGGLFMNSGTGGGFSTSAGNLSLTLVTTIGGSTPATLQWESGGFLPDGAPLILKPTGGIITLNNDIALDNGTAGAYKLREIYVGSGNYASVGHIYGSSTTDLIKTGPGELRMIVGHYFTGNFIIAEGSVRLINGSLFTSSTSLIVKSGGTLIIEAGVIFADVILEPGGTIQGAYGPVMYGNLVYNGGTMNCTSGGCYWTFFGASQSCIDGQAVDFHSNGYVYVNNNGGVLMNNNVTTGYLSFNGITSTFSIGSNTLTLNECNLSAQTRIKCNGSSNLVINGSGSNYSSLYFDQTTPGVTNRLNNFTFNRSSSGSGTINNALQVAGTLTMSNGTLTTGGNLTLASDASVTAYVAPIAAGAAISGNVRVQRFIPASGRRWRYLSSPCSGRTLADWQGEIHITGAGGASNGFDATTSNAPSVFSYDETVTTGTLDNGWTAATANTNAITVGKGYRVFVRGPRTDNGLLDNSNPTQNAVTLDVVGSLNTGYINMPVSYTSSGTAANDGWCLVGNPYPAGYDWDYYYNLGNSQDDGFWYLNINPTIYIFNAATNAYCSYNALAQSGTLTNGIIPSGAAFFVKTTPAPTMIFAEDFKTIANPLSLHKKGKADEFTIKFYADSSQSDEFIFKNMAEATGLNDKYDIQKLQNPDLNLGSYGVDDVQLSLDCQPLTAAFAEVKLNVNATSEGVYNFSFSNLENFEPAVSVLLKDKFLSKLIDIRTNKTYNFAISVDENSKGKNRFSLLFNCKTTDIETLNLQPSTLNLSIYPIPAKDVLNVSLTGQVNDAVEIKISDLTGKTLRTFFFSKTEAQQNLKLNIAELTAGVYFVEIVSVSTTPTRSKKFIKL